MKRDVFLTKKAEQQLNNAADWYADHSPELGDRWFHASSAPSILLNGMPSDLRLPTKVKHFRSSCAS